MKKVLIIEDEKNLNELYEIFISRWGYETVTAFDGAEGLNLYHTEKPDAIITDNNLPKITGRDLVNIIRETDIQIPILWHTGDIVPMVKGIQNLYVGQKGLDIEYIRDFLQTTIGYKDGIQLSLWND